MNIEFFEEDYSYRLDGEPVDHVTNILREEGFIDDTWFTPTAMERGTHIHEGTELLDLKALELSDFEGTDIYPYLEAWERFKTESGYTNIKIEVPVGSKRCGYAGRIDRVMESKAGEEFIIDIKSGGHSLWHGLQLAAYRIAFIDTFGYNVNGVRVIHLKKTGKYSICDGDKSIGKYDESVWESHWITIISARALRKQFRGPL